MPTKLLMAIWLMIMTGGCVSTGTPFSVNLGEKSDSLFKTDNIKRVSGGDHAFLGFSGYRTLSHDLIRKHNAENVIRAGLVLKGKSILVDSLEATAVFGNDTDSCRLQYTTIISRIRNGKSGLGSVLNIISTLKEKKIQEPQRAPDTTLSSVETSGTLDLNGQNASFYFKHHYLKDTAWKGWLVFRGDTILLRTITQLKDKNGKPVISNPSYTGGFEWTKQGKVIALLDLTSSAEGKVYLLNQLGEPQKLIMASCLFIAACYR